MTPEARLAFEAISKSDLQTLKKHPFWDKSSPVRNPKAFRELVHPAQTMLIAATFSGNIETVKFLVEEVKVDIN